MTKRHLEAIRWASAAACLASWGALAHFQTKGGVGVLLFFGGFLLGLPGAMLTLHLQSPKWFKYLDRPKRQRPLSTQAGHWPSVCFRPIADISLPRHHHAARVLWEAVTVLALFLSAALLTHDAELRAVTPNRLIEGQDSRVASEVADARRLLSSVDHCSLAGIPGLQVLLRKYEGRPEPELKLLAAEARYRAGDTLRFRQHDEEAEHWFGSVVRLYGGQSDIRFQRIVARSNYMLGVTGHNDARKEKHLRRVLSAYRETDDLELLQTYARSLHALSDIRRASRQNAEADLLAKQGSELYRDRIIPRLPPPDPNAPICV